MSKLIIVYVASIILVLAMMVTILYILAVGACIYFDLQYLGTDYLRYAFLLVIGNFILPLLSFVGARLERKKHDTNPFE